MRIRLMVFGVIAALLAAAPPIQAQLPVPARFESWQPDLRAQAGRIAILDSTIAKGSGSGMLLGGIGGTLVGWLAGLAVGAAVSDWEGGNGPAYGAMVGATVGVPVGVHFGNHAQGSLLNDLLVSAAIGAVGIAVTSATQSGIPILLTPLAQVIATIAMEDHATRKAALRDASQ